MIDGKRLGVVGFQKLGTPYSEMDCQKFVEWCLEQCGLKMDLAGSNTWFREVRSHGRVLTPEECVRELGCVPAGAFLFILEHDGKEPEKYRPDGLGNASHIGLVTGKGEGAIHSSASRGCVAESKFKGKSISGGWNMVGLYDKVIYDYGKGGADSGEDPAPEPVPDPAPEPVKEFAVVWSEDDIPVNTRKGPGRSYAMSKAGKIPVGERVEILKRTQNSAGEEWCQIRVADSRGATWICWMMVDFLQAAGSGDGFPQQEEACAPVDDITAPADDFGQEDMDAADDVVIQVHLTRKEAAVLLPVLDGMSWQLVQILGGRG